MTVIALLVVLVLLGVLVVLARIARTRGRQLAGAVELADRRGQQLVEMAEVARRFAAGDLTVAVRPRSEQDVLGLAFGEMHTNLNALVGEVSSVADGLAAVTGQMASASEHTGTAVGEIAQAMGDVAQGAERQVASLDQVRVASDEMRRATAESVEHAEQTARAAAQARTVADQGEETVSAASARMSAALDAAQTATAAIRRLGEKSEQVGGIVEAITGIAEQTNLLALNAAIEAARAGEQGRGFAVVAEEVRKLAEESRTAAASIGALIVEIQAEIAGAVGLVETGGQRTDEGARSVERVRSGFSEIRTGVEDMAEQVGAIAAWLQQIDGASRAVQEGIADVGAVAEQSSASTQQVAASTQETTASAEEIASSARTLAHTTEQLQGVVGRFQIDLAQSGSLATLMDKAIAAHNQWKARLRQAIASGHSDVSVEAAGRDDGCALGKWLHGDNALHSTDRAGWQRMHDLHETFHANAATILRLALDRRADEARAALADPAFLNTTSELTRLLETVRASAR